MTSVNEIRYDFVHRTGTVYMPHENCTDMDGTIRFFERIDPGAVKRIVTFCGGVQDVSYARIHGDEWKCGR